MGNDGNFYVKQWRAHGCAKQWLIARVVWVSNEGNTSRDQLWASGGNGDVARTIGARKVDGVVCARSFAIFKFGLCDCSSKVNIPQRGGFLRICLTTRQVANECCLACASCVITNGGVQQRPIDGKPESAKQIFKDLFVLMRKLDTQLDEVWS